MHACQLSAVKEACCAYLLEILDEDHAARTLSLAAKYSCEELLARAAAYASGRFHAMRPDALAECGRPLFAGLVARDDLSVHSELQARVHRCSRPHTETLPVGIACSQWDNVSHCRASWTNNLHVPQRSLLSACQPL